VTPVKQTKLDQYRIVYFATHALVSGETEQVEKGLAEPAIVLSLPATATALDDGLLTSSQVAQLKLNAGWVVLSACNMAAADRHPIFRGPLAGLARSRPPTAPRALAGPSPMRRRFGRWKSSRYAVPEAARSAPSAGGCPPRAQQHPGHSDMPNFLCAFNAGTERELSECAMKPQLSTMTLNQRVLGSSPSAPTKIIQ
jgi:hypothetical protein